MTADGEIEQVRSALIEALWDSGRHGCGLDECTDTVACPACQADLGADVDAMLGALGLEAMAGYCPIHGGIVTWEDGIATCGEDDGDEPCQVVPLYRMASLFGSHVTGEDQ